MVEGRDVTSTPVEANVAVPMKLHFTLILLPLEIETAFCDCGKLYEIHMPCSRAEKLVHVKGTTFGSCEKG